MGKFVVPVTHHHVCFSAHPGMHRVMTEQQTKSRIMRVCRHASDRVTGIDVFQGDIHFDFFKIVLNPVFEEKTDIAKADVAGFIAFAGGFN